MYDDSISFSNFNKLVNNENLKINNLNLNLINRVNKIQNIAKNLYHLIYDKSEIYNVKKFVYDNANSNEEVNNSHFKILKNISKNTLVIDSDEKSFFEDSEINNYIEDSFAKKILEKQFNDLKECIKKNIDIKIIENKKLNFVKKLSEELINQEAIEQTKNYQNVNKNFYLGPFKTNLSVLYNSESNNLEFKNVKNPFVIPIKDNCIINEKINEQINKNLKNITKTQKDFDKNYYLINDENELNNSSNLLNEDILRKEIELTKKKFNEELNKEDLNKEELNKEDLNKEELKNEELKKEKLIKINQSENNNNLTTKNNTIKENNDNKISNLHIKKLNKNIEKLIDNLETYNNEQKINNKEIIENYDESKAIEKIKEYIRKTYIQEHTFVFSEINKLSLICFNYIKNFHILAKQNNDDILNILIKLQENEENIIKLQNEEKEKKIPIFGTILCSDIINNEFIDFILNFNLPHEIYKNNFDSIIKKINYLQIEINNNNLSKIFYIDINKYRFNDSFEKIMKKIIFDLSYKLTNNYQIYLNGLNQDLVLKKIIESISKYFYFLLTQTKNISDNNIINTVNNICALTKYEIEATNNVMNELLIFQKNIINTILKTLNIDKIYEKSFISLIFGKLKICEFVYDKIEQYLKYNFINFIPLIIGIITLPFIFILELINSIFLSLNSLINFTSNPEEEILKFLNNTIFKSIKNVLQNIIQLTTFIKIILKKFLYFIYNKIKEKIFNLIDIFKQNIIKIKSRITKKNITKIIYKTILIISFITIITSSFLCFMFNKEKIFNKIKIKKFLLNKKEIIENYIRISLSTIEKI